MTCNSIFCLREALLEHINFCIANGCLGTLTAEPSSCDGHCQARKSKILTFRPFSGKLCLPLLQRVVSGKYFQCGHGPGQSSGSYDVWCAAGGPVMSITRVLGLGRWGGGGAGVGGQVAGGDAQRIQGKRTKGSSSKEDPPPQQTPIRAGQPPAGLP